MHYAAAFVSVWLLASQVARRPCSVFGGYGLAEFHVPHCYFSVVLPATVTHMLSYPTFLLNARRADVVDGFLRERPTGAVLCMFASLLSAERILCRSTPNHLLKHV